MHFNTSIKIQGEYSRRHPYPSFFRRFFIYVTYILQIACTLSACTRCINIWDVCNVHGAATPNSLRYVSLSVIFYKSQYEVVLSPPLLSELLNARGGSRHLWIMDSPPWPPSESVSNWRFHETNPTHVRLGYCVGSCHLPACSWLSELRSSVKV
jgi:hypothetical protein